MVCKADCSCWKCYLQGFTFKDAAVAAGTVVGTAAVLGWGMSSLLSSSSGTTTDEDDGKRKLTYGSSQYGSGSWDSTRQINFKSDFHDKLESFSSSSSKGRMFIQPERQNEEIYIMNCDGSDNTFSGGYGALIRDSRGEPIAAAAGESESVDVTVQELKGLEAGLKLAEAYGIKSISVRSDCQTVVDLVTGKYLTYKLPNAEILARILKMVENYQQKDFKISHIDGANNGAADCLAKLRPGKEYVEMSPSEFDKRLKNIIREEKESFINSLDY